MFDKSILFSFAAGVVAGIVGAKFYDEHKNEINEKLKGLNGLNSFKFGAKEEDKSCEDSSCNKEGLSIEELEAQKERLEDLIAELKQNEQNKASEA